MQVDDFDLALVGNVAMSSAGNNLPRILRGVLTRTGAASTPELVADSGLTHPTVRHYMRLLGERGLAVHTKASPETVELTGAVRGAVPGAALGERRRAQLKGKSVGESVVGFSQASSALHLISLSPGDPRLNLAAQVCDLAMRPVEASGSRPIRGHSLPDETSAE